MDQLEAETGRYYGLTAALPCGPSIIANQDIEHVGRLLTELNLMTYDFHGSWNEMTGVNTPLYDQEDSPEFSVHGCVENWLEGGAPKEKINIGFVSTTLLGVYPLLFLANTNSCMFSLQLPSIAILRTFLPQG